MTFSAPSTDFYDDGLVHSHDWSRSTPPGGAHDDRGHASVKRAEHGHDEGLSRERQ